MSELNVFLQRTITTLLWLAGAYIFFRWLLVPLLPFLLALGLSAMLEPLDVSKDKVGSLPIFAHLQV